MGMAPWGVGVLYLLAVVGATLAWLGKAGLGAFWLRLVFVGAHVAYAIGLPRLTRRVSGKAERQSCIRKLSAGLDR